MRTYRETHPWITFGLDLQEASHKLWLLLGEAQAKCQQISHVPLLPDVARRLYGIYLAKGVLATTAIEGNTLTEEEVQRRLEGQLDLPSSREYLGHEIDNIVRACNLIGERVFQQPLETWRLQAFQEYNRLVLEGLPLNEGVIPGQIRAHNVTVGRYRGAPAEDCEYLVEQLCAWLNQRWDDTEDHSVAFGILKAIVAHVYIAWIHPFADGNGHTARLIEFQILLAAGVPDAAAHLMSNHYNRTRSEYYRQLGRTHESGGNLLPFIEYALQGFVDGLDEQLETVTQQQMDVHWKNHTHNQFQGKNRPSDLRRRNLILALSLEKESIPLLKVRHISPEVAEAYAGKSQKTVMRDIVMLESMGLVERASDGVRAKKETMRAFLPRAQAWA